jgi:hypothetical protein
MLQVREPNMPKSGPVYSNAAANIHFKSKTTKTFLYSKRSTISLPRDVSFCNFVIYGPEYLGSIPDRRHISLLAVMLIKLFGCHRVFQKLQ